MSGVDQNLGLRTGGLRQDKGHAPVGDIGVVEGGLERFVFHQHALVGSQPLMRGAQPHLEALLAVADVLRAGIIRPVGEPQGKVPAGEAAADLDRVQNVVERSAANLGVGVP